MNKRKETSISRFAADLYDMMGMNNITQRQFYDKYVEPDEAFQLDEFEDESEIQFDDFIITIKRR